MELLQGFPQPPQYVCCLRQAIYDLKQVPRVWFKKLSSIVIVVGFTQSVRDHAIFVHLSPRGRTIQLL